MHCCNINKSRRGDFFFGSPGIHTLIATHSELHSENTKSIITVTYYQWRIHDLQTGGKAERHPQVFLFQISNCRILVILSAIFAV